MVAFLVFYGLVAAICPQVLTLSRDWSHLLADDGKKRPSSAHVVPLLNNNSLHVWKRGQL
jgi:hypothetical protein